MSRTYKNAKQFFKLFRELLKKNKLSFWTIILSVFLFVLILALPIWRIIPLSKNQPFIPLHYNVYFGVDRFGPWYMIFVLPIVGFVFLIINIALQTRFAESEKLLTRFFAVSTVLLEIVLFVAMALIILLNV